MKELTSDEMDLLHLCAREETNRLDPDVGDTLERRGLAVFLYEGLKFEGTWRLTTAGRQALRDAQGEM
jgi:hypothetical protein